MLVPDSWRVTNARDIIPSVPRLLGYAHVKHSVRLSEDGKLTIQGDDGGVADVFGEGKGGVDVIKEFMDQVQAEVSGALCGKQALRQSNCRDGVGEGQSSAAIACRRRSARGRRCMMMSRASHPPTHAVAACDCVPPQKRTWEEVYEEIKSAELAILDTLVSGEALEQHMEDFYLNTLKQVRVVRQT